MKPNTENMTKLASKHVPSLKIDKIIVSLKSGRMFQWYID